MARTRASASAVRDMNATPQMPHTLLLDLRSVKKSAAGVYSVLEGMKARDSQPVIHVPGEKQAATPPSSAKYPVPDC